MIELNHAHVECLKRTTASDIEGTGPVKIVPYGPDHERAHFEFASRHWNKRKRTTAEYIYWKFRGCPGETLDTFLLAVEEGRVIGQLGLIPCTLLVNGSSVEAQWACELMVDNEYRGKGIARRLYDFALQLRPVTLGSDPSKAAAISMKRAGFFSVPGPVKFFYPLYLGEVTRLKRIELPWLDRIPNPFNLLFRIWKRVGGIEFEQVDVSTYLNCVDDKDDCRESCVRVSHKDGFADWRFTPFKNFYNGIECFSDNEGTAFSLYRHPRTIILTEHLTGPEVRPLICILSTVITAARKSGVRGIKLLAETPGMIRVLPLLGLVRFRTPTEIIVYCNDPDLKETLIGSSFRYTYLDSDENI